MLEFLAHEMVENLRSQYHKALIEMNNLQIQIVEEFKMINDPNLHLLKEIQAKYLSNTTNTTSSQNEESEPFAPISVERYFLIMNE
mmetsp:Transcript_12948/g.21909  ORF Transcript_12948/g.21909 Transcript_12948/m.21909 type:complete len:86 (+) Transcript_12948:25-282(+)